MSTLTYIKFIWLNGEIWFVIFALLDLSANFALEWISCVWLKVQVEICSHAIVCSVYLIRIQACREKPALREYAFRVRLCNSEGLFKTWHKTILYIDWLVLVCYALTQQSFRKNLFMIKRCARPKVSSWWKAIPFGYYSASHSRRLLAPEKRGIQYSSHSNNSVCLLLIWIQIRTISQSTRNICGRHLSDRYVQKYQNTEMNSLFYRQFQLFNDLASDYLTV